MATSATTSSPPSSSSQSDSSSPGPDEIFPYQLSTADPLSYLLKADNNKVDDSSAQFNALEWSPFASFFEQENKGHENRFTAGDFTFSLPMDLDFDSNMAIDPSSLHFNTSIFTRQDPVPPGFDPSGTFEPQFFTNFLDQTTPLHNRRLSVTSSPSSGASLSPVVAQLPTPASSVSGEISNSEDSAAELAQRVRHATGVTFALPLEAKQDVETVQSKLPIPRLPRPVQPVSNLGKPTSTSSFPDLQSGPNSTSLTSSVVGRPKTSHTTIERRYRTNLNARIINLKQSVPALRVLEARLNGKDTSPNDIVDERGFVDGVKVGRKMSKANVLGKAAEYIKVLKRRELRLKREQDGLKSLVGGLVNGPALLQAWESQWRESFGGEEKDEIDEETASDDEDGDGEGDDDDDESGRAKKRRATMKTVLKDKVVRPPTVLPASKPTMPTPSVIPEKRKRGRPRKLVAPTAAGSDGMAVDTSGMGGQPLPSNHQQYLLAVFAFISFFNSPLTNYSPPYAQPHSHTGSVLNSPVNVGLPAGYGWRDLIQIFHLTMSALVFFSFIFPWLPNGIRQNKFTSKVLSPLSSLFPATSRLTSSQSATVVSSPSVHGIDSVVLLDALSPSCQGTPAEARALRKALAISSGIIGLCRGVFKAGKTDRGIEFNQLEQRAWVRLGEIVALDDNVSIATRLQTYWGMSWHISTFSALPVDLVTLALVIRPVSGSRAACLWERAGKHEFLRPYEKLVLETMDVQEAATRLDKLRTTGFASYEKLSPLGIVGEMLVRERIKQHATVIFIMSIDRTRNDYSDSEDSEDESYLLDANMEEADEGQRSQTISAGRSLGGATADLALSFEKVWDMGTCDLDNIQESEVKTLLIAVVLYRRTFRTSLVDRSRTEDDQCSVILTPPPSPSHRDAETYLVLRKVLGSSAFESCEHHPLALALEDARDRVVDMLIDSRAGGF